jgi:hypothetical protein
MPRRRFLQGGAGLSALAALGGASAASSLLTGCASDLTGSGTLPLPRRDNPVKWPVFAGNTAIKSGLQPERDATLGSIMLAMSLIIVIVGYVGYRLLTRGERGGGLAALTAISGEGT